MIYLDQSSQMMFCTKEACQNHILEGMYDEIGEFAQSDSISQEFSILLFYLFNKNETGVKAVLDTLNGLLNNWKHEQMSSFYAEEDNDQERALLDEGYFWGE